MGSYLNVQLAIENSKSSGLSPPLDRLELNCFYSIGCLIGTCRRCFLRLGLVLHLNLVEDQILLLLLLLTKATGALSPTHTELLTLS